MALFEVENLHTYGKIRPGHLALSEGEIVTPIGGNGAGKTTTPNTICVSSAWRKGVCRCAMRTSPTCRRTSL